MRLTRFRFSWFMWYAVTLFAVVGVTLLFTNAPLSSTSLHPFAGWPAPVLAITLLAAAACTTVALFHRSRYSAYLTLPQLLMLGAMAWAGAMAVFVGHSASGYITSRALLLIDHVPGIATFIGFLLATSGLFAVKNSAPLEERRQHGLLTANTALLAAAVAVSGFVALMVGAALHAATATPVDTLRESSALNRQLIVDLMFVAIGASGVICSLILAIIVFQRKTFGNRYHEFVAFMNSKVVEMNDNIVDHRVKVYANHERMLTIMTQTLEDVEAQLSQKIAEAEARLEAVESGAIIDLAARLYGENSNGEALQPAGVNEDVPPKT